MMPMRISCSAAASSWPDEDKGEDIGCLGTSSMSVEAHDEKALYLLLRNLRNFVSNRSTGAGTKTKEHQQQLDTIAAAMISTDIFDGKLVSAVERLTGFTRVQQHRGLNLAEQNRQLLMQANDKQLLGIKRKANASGSRSKLDLDWIYKWFHEDCPLVDVDKTRRQCYKRKLFSFNGTQRRLDCQRRIISGKKQDAIKSFLESDKYSHWLRQTGRTIHPKTVGSCICPCIKEAKPVECACPVCVEFRYLLSAWNEQRKKWHATPCKCPGCTGPRFGEYMAASQSTTHFKQALCCKRQPYPHLKLPHLPGEIPHFYPLRCCAKSDLIPGHVQPCEHCGWARKMYNHHDCVERNYEEAKWKRWKLTNIDGVNERKVLQEHTGTRRELLNTIISR